jgi:hypothetical protein
MRPLLVRQMVLRTPIGELQLPFHGDRRARWRS